MARLLWGTFYVVKRWGIWGKTLLLYKHGCTAWLSSDSSLNCRRLPDREAYKVPAGQLGSTYYAVFRETLPHPGNTSFPADHRSAITLKALQRPSRVFFWLRAFSCVDAHTNGFLPPRVRHRQQAHSLPVHSTSMIDRWVYEPRRLVASGDAVYQRLALTHLANLGRHFCTHLTGSTDSR